MHYYIPGVTISWGHSLLCLATLTSNQILGSMAVTRNPNRSGLVTVLCMIGLNSWSSTSQRRRRASTQTPYNRKRNIFRRRVLEAVSGQAHNLEVGGSIPSSATSMRVDRTRGVQRPSKPIMRSSTLPTRSKTFRCQRIVRPTRQEVR